jgi:hypothetical protein
MTAAYSLINYVSIHLQCQARRILERMAAAYSLALCRRQPFDQHLTGV